MSNPWFRLYSEFSHDPKIQRMSEADQRRFVMLLCLRCSNGDVTLHDEDVTFQLRISNEEWQVTKALFISKNLIDDGNNPVAWNKRQFVSDSSAPRVAKHRAMKKKEGNVTVTPPEQIQNRTDTEQKRINLLTKKTEVGGDFVPPSAPPTKKGSEKAKGARLQKDWELPKSWGVWALEQNKALTTDDIRKEANKFKNHWLAKAGKDAVKLDWYATWRNWITSDFVKPSGSPPPEESAQWFLSATGITAKGATVNIVPLDGENFPSFKGRVFAHFKVTDEMVRNAQSDKGKA